MSASDEYPIPPVPTPPGDGGSVPAYPPPRASQAPRGASGEPYLTPGYHTPIGRPAPDAFAGFWIRFAAALIDGLLLGVLTALVQAIVNGGGLLGFVVAGGYFTYFHSTPAGQTVGNRVVGIRIVDSDTGGHLDHVRALLRWLMSYVSGMAIFIGYLWMLWDPYKQTWHDKVAHCYVVRASHHPPPTEFGKPPSST